MEKLSKKQEREFFFLLEREKIKLEEIFKSIKLKKNNFSEIFNLAESYFEDMKYFLNKKEYVKVFELENYIWGLLDGLAILKVISVPKKFKKYFKADF